MKCEKRISNFEEIKVEVDKGGKSRNDDGRRLKYYNSAELPDKQHHKVVYFNEKQDTSPHMQIIEDNDLMDNLISC